MYVCMYVCVCVCVCVCVPLALSLSLSRARSLCPRVQGVHLGYISVTLRSTLAEDEEEKRYLLLSLESRRTRSDVITKPMQR